MDYSVKYDDSNPISIETYAKNLIGHTFKDVLEWNQASQVREDAEGCLLYTSRCV